MSRISLMGAVPSEGAGSARVTSSMVSLLPPAPTGYIPSYTQNVDKTAIDLAPVLKQIDDKEKARLEAIAKAKVLTEKLLAATTSATTGLKTRLDDTAKKLQESVTLKPGTTMKDLLPENPTIRMEKVVAPPNYVPQAEREIVDTDTVIDDDESVEPEKNVLVPALVIGSGALLAYLAFKG